MRSRLARARVGRAAASLLCAGLFASIVPGRLQAQQGTLAGVVIDADRTTPVAGASVRLSALPPLVTDSAGRFRAPGVPLGRYVLTIAALGFRVRTLELTLRADTTLRIELQRAPALLDPLIVRAGNVTVTGIVRDSATGDRLMQAQVTIHPGGRTIGAISGDFRIEDAPRGEPITLIFEALEHLPREITLVAGRDTSLAIALAVDSVGVRLLARQLQRLENRSRAEPTSVHAIQGAALREDNLATVGDIVRRRLPPGTISDRWPYYRGACLFFDDLRVTYDVLIALPIEAIARIEIYGARGRMIRVYSKRYVASLMGEPMLPTLLC